VTRQVDRASGRLASDWCATQVYTEYFIPGTEPTEVCDPYGGTGLFGTPLRRMPTDSVLDTVRVPLRPRPRDPRDTLPGERDGSARQPSKTR
jgi:hypothetical protein